MIYTIQSETASATIDSLGAQLSSLQKNGVEYIWQKDPAFWSSSAPILFPVVGRLRDNLLRVDGKTYPMNKHGVVRDAELTLVSQTKNAITLRLTHSPETLQRYPWQFQLDLTFSLEGDALTTKFQVTNLSDSVMFFGLGGHPAFRVPVFAEEAFTDYQLEFEKEERLESNRVLPDDAISGSQKDLILESGRILSLHRSLFNNDALIFEDIQSKWVRLVHKKGGHGIRFSYADFSTLGIWTKGEPHEANYVCLEPWMSMGFRDDESGELKDKCGILSLDPGAVFEASFTAEIIA